VEKISSLFARFRRNSPLWLLQRLFAHIPGKPIKLHIRYFFKYTGDHDSVLRARFPGTIRWGDQSDLPGIIECAGRSKDEFFKQRIKNGDRCIVAVEAHDSIQAYGWLCMDNRHIEDKTGFVLEFPRRSLYAYDIYITPKYRLTGIWVGIMQLILDSAYYHPDAGLHCFIDYGNTASLKPHIRYGFKVYQRTVILSFMGRSFRFTKPIEHNESVVRQIVQEG